jgi:(p)ppGpp synthase/HD superfamily hydrolase
MMIPLSHTPQMELALALARTVHANQPYGKDENGEKMSYEDGHLRVIAGILEDASLDSEDDRMIAYLHDSIEDAQPSLRILIHDTIKKHFSDHVYQVVWAMTGIGENRPARNASYYEKIGQYPKAANYKLADRIANVENSKANLHVPKCERLFNLYAVKEDESFREKVVAHATNSYLVARYNEAVSIQRPRVGADELRKEKG